MEPILLGALFSFASADGRDLFLSVSFAQPSTVSIEIGSHSLTASAARTFQVLGPIRWSSEPTAYRLSFSRGVSHGMLPRAPQKGHLNVVVYGDSRDGEGPHRVLVQAMKKLAPQVFVHTGDTVFHARDSAGWGRHLAAMAPLGDTPLLFALGNHDISTLFPGAVGSLEQELPRLVPPSDPLRDSLQVPASVYRVWLGPALFLILDSNLPLGAGSVQLRFARAALVDRGGARFVFVAMHHGPRSSGLHGGHPQAEALTSLFQEQKVTAVFSGHDHLYERIVEDEVTYVVSGGGGAPLYPRGRAAGGSVAFASTYHFVSLDLSSAGACLYARSLEGVLLDRAELGANEGSTVCPSSSEEAPAAWSMRRAVGPQQKPYRRARLIGAGVLLFAGLALVVRRMLF